MAVALTMFPYITFDANGVASPYTSIAAVVDEEDTTLSDPPVTYTFPLMFKSKSTSMPEPVTARGPFT